MPLPPGTRILDVTYPGIKNGVRSFRYDCQHGISPNTALIVTNPQDQPPAGFGTLTWSDGVMAGALAECKLKKVTAQIQGDGFVYTLEILDRRWQWEYGTFPGGGGHYNQLDPNNKLIPWTIRSPTELALLCIQAMGVKSFRINGLPNGLSSTDGLKQINYLQTGQNYPITAANPPVNWDGIPPAIALSELCERYGCRVMFQPFQDRLLIDRLGSGIPLPTGGSIAVSSLAVTSPETPIAVGVYGAPTEYQMRLALKPVALEWDGHNHYVDQLDVSYAPKNPNGNQNQITRCEVRPAIDATSGSATLTAWLNNEQFTASTLSALVTLINANVWTRSFGITCVLTSASVMTLIASKPEPFDIRCTITGGSTTRSRFDARITQPHKNKNVADWSKSTPPTFPGIQSTDRLSLYEARQLAAQSIWRSYRVMDEDVEFAHKNARLRRLGIPAPFKPIIVPGLGPIRDRRQIIISNRKVDQVVPSPRLQGGIALNPQVVQGTLGGGILPEYYNGIARNQAARVYGQFAIQCGSGSVLWNTRAGANTNPMTLLKVDFSVDAFAQVITFNEPVFRSPDQGGQGIYFDPELILECAVTVRDPVTWTEIRPSFYYGLEGGVALPEYLIKDDVIANVVGVYDDTTNHLKSITSPPEDVDGPLRAQQYLLGMAAKYQTKAAQILKWNGIMKIDPDGLIQQVSFTMDSSGVYTHASTNSEFSTYLPNYSARRNRENLAADPDAVQRNIGDQGPGQNFLRNGALIAARRMGGGT